MKKKTVDPLIEKWAIKYLDEPKETRNLILHHAQQMLSGFQFSELLEILIWATQQDYENAIKLLKKT